MPHIRCWAGTLKPGLFLDAGSGTGLYRSVLEKAGNTVVAADISPEMLRVQTQHHLHGSVVAADIRILPFRSASFDYVLGTRVLSHIPDIAAVFAEFRRVAKSGAQMLISDVHPEHRYSNMSIPVGTEKVSINTYKHPIKGLEASLAAASLDVVWFREFRLSELTWRPPPEKFDNIYVDIERPIFYIFVLRRL